MTPEEAIDFISNKIQIDVRFCSDDDINKTETALKLAISALEKQIPKKPIPTEEQNIRYVMNYTCPSCGKHFIGTGIANYCYHCGQALDWRETE